MDTTRDTITEIPLEQLHDSPFQPRSTYTGIEDLAANIKAEGRIHQPLLVRPRLPSLLRTDHNPDDGYEIVFGHRRYRGAEAAGLVTAPCIVRAMSDAEVRSAQMAENVQREAMLAIEEAQGFRAQLAADQLTADDIAARIGKSRSFVYSRLKLLDLCPEVRNALLAGEVDTEVALYIARVGNAKMQGKALAYIRSKYYSLDDGGKKSVRQIRELLNERFTLSLAKAPFNIEDEMLVPLAGHCVRCPKRSGNAPEFIDLVDYGAEPRQPYGRLAHTGPDVCTDPDCFDSKKVATLKRQAVALEAKGKVVIDGNKARAAVSAIGEVKGAYIALKDVKTELASARLAAQKNSKVVPPQVVLIQDPRTGKTFEAVKRDELVAAGVKVKAAPKSHQQNYEAQRLARQAENEKAEAKAKAETAVRMAILLRVRSAIAATERSAFDLQMLAPMVFEAVDYHARTHLATLYGAKSHHEIEQRIAKMDVATLTLFMLDCALIGDAYVHPFGGTSKPEQLLAAAKHYGIDAEAIRRELAEGGSTPSSAARAPKAAPAAGAKTAKPKAGPKAKGQKVKDDAGSAGEQGATVATLEEADA